MRNYFGQITCCWAYPCITSAFHLPSRLTWIIVRINRTFTFDSTTCTFQGLAKGKKALIITPSAGNFVVGTPLGNINYERLISPLKPRTCQLSLHLLMGMLLVNELRPQVKKQLKSCPFIYRMQQNNFRPRYRSGNTKSPLHPGLKLFKLLLFCS